MSQHRACCCGDEPGCFWLVQCCPETPCPEPPDFGDVEPSSIPFPPGGLSVEQVAKRKRKGGPFVPHAYISCTDADANGITGSTVWKENDICWFIVPGLPPEPEPPDLPQLSGTTEHYDDCEACAAPPGECHELLNPCTCTGIPPPPGNRWIVCQDPDAHPVAEYEVGTCYERTGIETTDPLPDGAVVLTWPGGVYDQCSECCISVCGPAISSPLYDACGRIMRVTPVGLTVSRCRDCCEGGGCSSGCCCCGFDQPMDLLACPDLDPGMICYGGFVCTSASGGVQGNSNPNDTAYWGSNTEFPDIFVPAGGPCTPQQPWCGGCPTNAPGTNYVYAVQLHGCGFQGTIMAWTLTVSMWTFQCCNGASWARYCKGPSPCPCGVYNAVDTSACAAEGIVTPGSMIVECLE